MIGSIGIFALRLFIAIVCVTIGTYIAFLRSKKNVYRRIGKVLMLTLFIIALIASLALLWLLMTGNFSFAYIVEYTSKGLPLIYRLAAFWGGSAGSLLFWLLVLSMYGATVANTRHEDSEQMLPIVNLIIASILLFYIILLNFYANPFQRLPVTALNGNGLNPLLENPGMTVHPVNLYLGYIGFTIPYAYAMTGLVLRKTDAVWLKVTRRWTLISWIFLSIGIIYGAHWSYEELGWGGYWAWDPVENASILPWFTATAFLHSAVIQERRGMLQRWNIVLITLTFLLTLFGTFLVRSGALWSIHAFTNGSMGVDYLFLMFAVCVFSTVLIVWRWPTLQSKQQFTSFVSKETGFVLNNVLFLGIAGAVLWGTIFPIVSEYIYGHSLMVGKSYYNAVVVPLFISVLILMGISQVISWRTCSLKTVFLRIRFPFVAAAGLTILLSFMLFTAYRHFFVMAQAGLFAAVFAIVSVLGEFWRWERRTRTGSRIWRHFAGSRVLGRRWYGGQIVHIAFALITIGIVGSGGYHVDKQVSMGVGDHVQIGGFSIAFMGLGTTQMPDHATEKLYANLLVKRGMDTLGVMRPSATFYQNGQAPTTNITLYSRPFRDLYVVLLGTGNDDKHALFDFHVNPMVEWIWFGGYLLILGTAISLWPEQPMYRHFAVQKVKEIVHPGRREGEGD